MKLKIVKEGNPILRKKAKPIRGIDEEIKKLAQDMKETLKTQKDPEGVGLAGPQVGKSLQIFVAKDPETPLSGEKRKFYTFINPKIISRSQEKETQWEGCLSIPEKFGPVPRSKEVTLEGLNPKGKKVKMKAAGILARIFQHEVDHLNGILFKEQAKGPLLSEKELKEVYSI